MALSWGAPGKRSEPGGKQEMRAIRYEKRVARAEAHPVIYAQTIPPSRLELIFILNVITIVS
jgi:hypothetical protein